MPKVGVVSQGCGITVELRFMDLVTHCRFLTGLARVGDQHIIPDVV